MKHLFIFIFLALLESSGFCQTPVTQQDFGKLAWIEGTWVRTNAKAGRSATEQWVKGNGEEWTGLTVSMKGSDTTLVERMKLITHDGAIYYVADVPENKEPVPFKVTAIDKDGFTCENPAHDFPKKIAYRREGNNLRAVISGDGKEIEYLFERKN
jgi:hypothetical protein